jgi:hypothetical protein
MSFESLVKKLMKEGKSKTAATKIAGSVANAKMKGAGSGPTAKQKARAKSPATKKPKPRAVIRDKDRVADKSRSYTDKKGRKIEIKTFKHEKAYDSGVKDDPNKPSMKRKSSRLSNTVELHKTKTKKDGTTKTKVKRAAGGGKKSQRLHTKFAKGKNKQGSSDVTITRKSPTTMKKQGYNARLDDSLGAKNGKKKQSMKSRRDESEGMEKKMGKKKFSGNKSSAQGKSPAKKPLVGGQKRLPKELQEAILKAPAKMLSKSGIKMMDKSPAMIGKVKRGGKVYKYKSEDSDRKIKGKDIASKKSSTKRKQTIKNKNVKKGEVKKTISKDRVGVTGTTKVKVKGGKNRVLKTDADYRAEAARKSPAKMKTPMKKSKQKVEQDYARNAIADYKSGKTKEAKYEKKKALEVAAGESMAKMKKSPSMMKGGEKRKVKKMAVKLGSSARPGKRTGNTEFKPMKMVPMPKMPKKHEYAYPKPLQVSMASPTKMKSNQDGGAYAAKNPAAPARQLKKLGSVLSKHFKSNR